LLIAGVLGFGATRAEPPPEVRTHEEVPRLDRFGDPLPPGAIHRFGTLRFRHDGIRNLAFTLDGKRLLAGGAMTSLAVFDAATGRKLRTVGKSIPNNSGAFALSPDGKRVACCGSDVSTWDLENGRLIRKLHCGRCTEAVFSPDGTKVAAIWEWQKGGDDFQTGVTVVEAATGNRLVEWTIKKGKPLEFGLHGLAYSPDGKFLAARFSELRKEKPFVYGVASSQVWLLDASTKTRVRTFGSADNPVLAFAFQPGSGRLTTFGNDSIIRFWDMGTGKEVHRFAAAQEKEENGFGALRFSADGRRCAVLTNRAKFLTVLDTKDGRVLRRIEGEESGLMVPIALSPDGRVIAAARLDAPCVRVWDVASGVERLPDAGHRAAAISLSLSADGRTLISRDSEGQRIHWNIQTSKGEIRPSDKREKNGQFTWSKDSSERVLRGPRWRMVFKNQEPAILEVWTLDGAKLLRKVEVSNMIASQALSPDGTHLAIATYGANPMLLLWNPEREEKPRKLQESPYLCRRLLFSHDSKRLITASELPSARLPLALWIWDAAKAQVIRKLETRNAPSHLMRTADTISHLILTADDQMLLAGMVGNDATVHAWDMETGKELAVLADPALKQTREEQNKAVTSRLAIDCLALSPDERFLAVITDRDDDSIVSVWETASWKLLRSFAPTWPRNRVQAMVFSHDGRSLFVANNDSTILEWDVSGRFGRETKKINNDRLNVLWQLLAETPDKAYPAVWELQDHPAASVPFLIDKVSPVKPMEAKRVRKLLAQLDSDSFAEREEASRQLLALGEQFVPMLRQVLKERPSLEMRRRIERILELLPRNSSAKQLPRSLSPDQQRLLRALAVLEWSGTAEAEKHLHRLAGGTPSASLTHAAKAAWQRRKH
jgi:WD40 repeat protein